MKEVRTNGAGTAEIVILLMSKFNMTIYPMLYVDSSPQHSLYYALYVKFFFSTGLEHLNLLLY